MKGSRMKEALEAIARRAVPENIDLWPRLETRLGKAAASTKPHARLSWSLVLLLLALILITTAAYALYRYLNDPGLQAAQDAGLITDVNATAAASLLTPQAPFAQGSGQAIMIGKEQTDAGITLRLDWVYVEDARQAFHISASGLAQDMRFGMPVLTYPDAATEGYSGAIFSLNGSRTVTGTYLSHQLVIPHAPPAGSLAMQIDVPLGRWQDGRSVPVANFHFELSDVEVTVPWGGGGGNSYAVRVNGLEMRLEHTVVAPGYTAAQLCYQLPSSGRDWVIENLTAQFSDNTQLLGEPVDMDAYAQVSDDGRERCADVSFPLGKTAGSQRVVITARGLGVPGAADAVDSVWQFSTALIDELRIGGMPAATPTPQAPLASETIGDLTATLQWAYLDSNRMAFTVHFDGWKDGYPVSYVTLRAADGTEVNAGADFHSAESDPATVLITMTPGAPMTLSRFQGQLIVDLNTSPAGDAPVTEFAFDIDLPVYQALTIESGQAVTANGVTMILQMVKTAPSFTVAYLCYQKPTPADWMIGDTTSLRIGSDQAGVNSYFMMFDSEYGDGGKGLEPGWKPALETGRCVKAGFPVGHHDQPESLTLTVPELQQSLPEMIPDADVTRALEELRAQGIDMDWMTVSGNGGGGGGPIYNKLPEGMTEEEAYRRFLNALGTGRAGPWAFTLQIEP